jgi:hypothetical protein
MGTQVVWAKNGGPRMASCGEQVLASRVGAGAASVQVLLPRRRRDERRGAGGGGKARPHPPWYVPWEPFPAPDPQTKRRRRFVFVYNPEGKDALSPYTLEIEKDSNPPLPLPPRPRSSHRYKNTTLIRTYVLTSSTPNSQCDCAPAVTRLA